MINPRISAIWSTTKEIAPFSCTPRVQEVQTKVEVVHLTPGPLGLTLSRPINFFLILILHYSTYTLHTHTFG